MFYDDEEDITEDVNNFIDDTPLEEDVSFYRGKTLYILMVTQNLMDKVEIL